MQDDLRSENYIRTIMSGQFGEKNLIRTIGKLACVEATTWQAGVKGMISLTRERLLTPQSRSLPRSGTWSVPQARSGLRHRRTVVCREVASSLRVAHVVCATALLLFLASGALADQTNTWEFTNAANYTISDSALLEVDETTPGYAQLILQAQNIYHADISNYLNSSSNSLVGMGTDVSLRLQGVPGTYSSSGRFTSRVFDGGAGNTWQMIHAQIGNRTLANTAAEVPNTDSGLVGLWHMNNNWNDSVGSANGVAVGAPYFTMSAKFGSHAGGFDGINDSVLGSAPGGLGLTDQISSSVWVNGSDMERQSVSYPITIANGASEIVALRVGGDFDFPSRGWRPRAISLVINGNNNNSTGSDADTMTDAADSGKWRHIVVTYDNTALPRTHIYKDGIELGIFEDKANGTIGAHDNIFLGIRSDGFWRWQGLIDPEGNRLDIA